MKTLFDAIPAEYFDDPELFLKEPEILLSELFEMLSDIEMQYYFTLIRVSGYRPTFRVLKQPGTFYSYIPDQRPITLQLIGKPSSGPSPPGNRTYGTAEALSGFTKFNAFLKI